MIIVLRTIIICYPPLVGQPWDFMDIIAAITAHLIESRRPVITDYDLCMTLFSLHKAKRYHRQRIDISTKILSFDTVESEIVRPLVDLGIIARHKDFPEGRVFRIVGSRFPEPGSVACSVDPFAYVSHLSAMEYHGLTDRLPKILFISTPPPREWAKFAVQKMEKDCLGLLKDYFKCNLPKLIRIKFDVIQKHRVNRYSSIHHGAFKNVEDKNIRISTIGRTFLDMLRKPEYCGGMRHVIEVFTSFGANYKRLIIDEIDRNGKAIEKARAGYLLEEYCDVKDERMDQWARHVQRGGSRMLDPKGVYTETFSERWCLSTNVGQ